MNFDVSRLRRSDRIIGASAIALFIFLFLFKWYGETASATTVGGVNVGSTSASFNGWHTFTNSRWIWLITIIVALVAVAVTGGALRLHSPIQLSVLVAALGALSTILIFYRIVHHPSGSASFGSFHASVGIKLGIWLGLLAAAGVTYGGYMAMQDEGTSIADVREQASAVVAGMSSQPAATGAPGPTTTSTAGPGAPGPSGANAPAPPGGSPAPPARPAAGPPAPPPGTVSTAPAPSGDAAPTDQPAPTHAPPAPPASAPAGPPATPLPPADPEL